MLFSLLIMAVTTSCASVDSYSNFRNILNSLVGHSINRQPWYGFAYKGKSIRSNLLDNGNVEYEFRGGRPHGGCVYAVEVERGSEIILRWQIKEHSEDCYVNP